MAAYCRCEHLSRHTISRDAGTGAHYKGTAPLPFERVVTGAQVTLHNRFHM